MKTIKLTESQFNIIFEASGNSAPNFNNGDLKEYPGSEVFTAPNVTDTDGNQDYGNPVVSDKITQMRTRDYNWTNAPYGTRL